MDLRMLRGRNALQESLLSRRLDAEREGRFLEFYRTRDGLGSTDVVARTFVSPASRRSYKEIDTRGDSTGSRELLPHGRGTQRPEYASLADIYEGALRKVLSIQLNLKIDEQPRFQDGNDVIRDKSSPPRPKALRLEDFKQHDEYRHRRRALDDENDPRAPPKGLTNLRKLGDRNSEGSAFHVPAKRRFDGVGFSGPMDREPNFQVERFGMVPSHFHSNVPPAFSARMDPARSPRLAPLGYVPSRSATQETYSQYSSHHREIPPLFSVRSASRERDDHFKTRKTEHESKERKSPDVRRSPGDAHKSPDVLRKSPDNRHRSSSDMRYKSHENNNRTNGFREKSLWNRDDGKTIIKVEQQDSSFDKLNFEEKFNKANDQITSTSLLRTGGALARSHCERRSPLSLRFRPYSLRQKYTQGLMNGKVADSTSDNHAKELGKNIKLEDRKVTGEEGEKEEFLSSLGLARINSK